MPDDTPGWLRQANHDPDAVASIYDDWAGDYDRDLADWDYRAPGLTVDHLAGCRPGAGPVLDVGCGTGLVGRHLVERGFDELVGIDLSARSLEVAATTGRYRDLHQVDLQSAPIPYGDGTFAALVCVGVMTYLPDTGDVVREFCRVVRPGGPVLFTQREDLWVERDCLAVIERAGAGRFRIEAVSEPLPYLPSSDEMADLPIRLVDLRVLDDGA